MSFGSLWRDANHNAIQVGGVVSRTRQTLSGNNTTVATPLFRITGSVQGVGLYATIITDLGSNQTAAYYRLNDQAAQVNITLNTGVTISSTPAGSLFIKKDLNNATFTIKSSAAGGVSEPSVKETMLFSPFCMTQKAGANTDVEFVYTTTNTPTSGVIEHFLVWLPLSADAAVRPL